jgi:hypothetical protein
MDYISCIKVFEPILEMEFLIGRIIYYSLYFLHLCNGYF